MAGFVLFGTAIAVGSLYPRLQLQGFGDGFDLGFHAAAYGGVTILGGILWRRLYWMAVAVFAYSTLIETLQYVVPGREVHISDLAANAIGVLAGLAIVAFWRSKQGVPELDDKVQ